MAMPTVAASKDAYRAGTSQAGQKWQEGASRTEVDPTALAAAAIASGKASANYAAATPRMQRGLANAGKQGWLAGIQRPEAVTSYQAGTSGKGADKWGVEMARWFPIFDSLSREIQSMPNNTPQDSINRVARWINGTIAAKQNL
jgi:hypothetical protein